MLLLLLLLALVFVIIAASEVVARIGDSVAAVKYVLVALHAAASVAAVVD